MENCNDLKTQIDNVPSMPGVYQYYDSNHRLLYVGKAKNLKKRIRSYFKIIENESFIESNCKNTNLDSNKSYEILPNPQNSLRIQQMARQIASIHTIIVDNEKEALILENSFIKSQNPKYNILLRDDKTYPYITIDLGDEFPRFSITRVIKKKKNVLYFGPYPKGAKEILNSIYELFPLVQEKSCLKGKKTCLYFQLEKCLGVCENKDSNTKEKYDNYVKNALNLMQNKHKMLKVLESKMLHYAGLELYERALACRNCIDVLKEIEHFSVVDLKNDYNAEILSFVYSGRQGVLLKLFIRNGKVASSYHIFVRANVLLDFKKNFADNTHEFEYEIYTQALLKILNEDSLSDEIIIANITESNFKRLQDSIPQIASKIVLPQKGNKARLANLANINAKSLLDNNHKLTENENEILEQIKNLFNLSQNIDRIEVFDTSHHAGSFCVGAMISYENNNFCKEKYRHYNLQGRDEYSQMKEMLARRAASFATEPAPNLWLLDGGKAQINLAKEILESVGANVEVLAIAKEKRDAKASRVSNRAKGRAKDTLRSATLEVRLSQDDKRLHFLQKLRDEAHRFAISFHRHKKRRAISKIV